MQVNTSPLNECQQMHRIYQHLLLCITDLNISINDFIIHLNATKFQKVSPCVSGYTRKS